MAELEIAALTVEDARRAQEGGAHSIEISRDLSVGGISPDFELVRRIRDAVTLRVYVMVRPRAGDFLYSAREFDRCLEEAQRLTSIGIEGVVFGAVDANGRVDVERMRALAQAAQPLITTLHRALDHSVEPLRTLEQLSGVIPRVLTGGPAATAYTARETLAAWVRAHGREFTFVISGGLTAEHICAMRDTVRADAYHVGSAARTDGAVDADKVRVLATTLL